MNHPGLAEFSADSVIAVRSRAFDHLEDGVVVTSLDGRIMDWNTGATRLFGWSRAEMLGKSPTMPDGGSETSGMRECILSLIAKGERWKGDIKFTRKDGTTGICESTVAPMRDEKGEIFAALGINHDVTERRILEGKLVEDKQLLVTLINALDDMIFVKDLQGKYLLVNAAHQTLCDLTPEEVIGKTAHELKGLKDHADHYHKDDMQVIETGRPIIDREEPFTTRDGTKGWFLTSKHPMRNDQGEIVALVGVARDITQRRRAQRALADEQEKLKTILDALPDPIFVKDTEGRHILHNATNLRLFGFRSGNLGETVFDIPIPRDHAESYASDDRQVIETGVPIVNREEPYAQPDGKTGFLLTSKFPLRDSDGRIVGLIGIGRDITDLREAETNRQNLESKLRETQKLESLGVLAGGIAHDFNNLLTGVLGNAGLALLDVEPGCAASECLGQIETAAIRASELCKQMLAYSGKGQFVLQRFNINQLIGETTSLLQLSINKGIVLRPSLQPDVPPILADRSQIQQVIMNLVINASDAIAQRSGSITIETFVIQAGAEFLSNEFLAPELAPGEYICLRITDDGCGMPTGVASRIFDPFFTTKFTGRGLGLAAVLGIVRGHHGAIKVESTEGRGTTFQVLFPTVPGPEDSRSAAAQELPCWKASGKALVIDDEETVRETTRRMLSALGFETISAASGSEGIKRFSRAPGEFAMVLLDLTMPDMGGGEVFAALRRIRADTPVLLASGFNEREAMARIPEGGVAGFIQKPFTVTQLREKLREIMDKG